MRPMEVQRAVTPQLAREHGEFDSHPVHMGPELDWQSKRLLRARMRVRLPPVPHAGVAKREGIRLPP